MWILRQHLPMDSISEALGLRLGIHIYIYIYIRIILYIYINIHTLEVGGESLTPTGKSFRFVRACERERRFDPGAGAIQERKLTCSCSGISMPARLSTTNVDFE